MIRDLIAVGIGGAAGSIARYLLSCTLLAGYALYGFPAGTFAVNVLGSLLIGLIAGIAGGSQLLTNLLIAGFCGGFTTFSTFSADTVRLLRNGEIASAVLYIGLSVAVCVACAALGMWIGQILKTN